MKSKKLMALLLTAAMTASVLTGCGGGQEATNGSTGGSEPAETSGGGKMRRPNPNQATAAVKILSISRCLLLCRVLKSMTAMKFRKLSHRRPV